MRYVLAPEGSSGDGSGSLGAAEAEEQQGKTASILPPQGRGSGCQCRGPAQRARSAKRTWRSAQAREGKSFGACSCGILTVAGAGKNALNGARAAAAGHLDVVHVLLHGAEGACVSVCVCVCVWEMLKSARTKKRNACCFHFQCRSTFGLTTLREVSAHSSA